MLHLALYELVILRTTQGVTVDTESVSKVLDKWISPIYITTDFLLCQYVSAG
jgi:hypothetical protein